MIQTYSKREKIKQLLILLVPILITQLGMFSMVFFNNLMSGRYSPSDLAGVAIGSSIWGPIFTGLSAILLAVSPIAAQRFGEKKDDEVSSIVAQGIYLAIIIASVVILIGFFALGPILDSMNLSSKVRNIAYYYLVGLSFGVIPLFIFNVLRSFIYSLGKTRLVMVITLIFVPINFIMNYIFIFGKFGVPEYGGIGAGYATSITNWLLTAITAIIILKVSPFSSFNIFSALKSFSLKDSIEILKIGVPMGLSNFFEGSIFSVVTILISKYDTITIASYQTALNIVSFLYMLPISVSLALTVVVGYEVGARRYKDAKEYSWLGILVSLLIALGSGILLLFFRYEVASIYSKNADVINLTGHFLIYALFFQLSDSVQATAQAALRGYKDVNVSFIMALVSYWFICLPVGYALANFTDLKASGYWIGLTTGLLAAGICLSMRLIYIQNKKFNHTSSLKGDI